MNKKLIEEKSAIDAEFQQKRDELQQERNVSNVSLTAMERVLDEIKSLGQQMKNDKQEHFRLEDEINETQYARTKLEQKVSSMKQRQITDQVKLEHDLKSEFESKKIQLEKLQEQVLKIKRLIAEESARREEGFAKRHPAASTDQQRVDKGLGEIKSLISDLTIGLPSTDDG